MSEIEEIRLTSEMWISAYRRMLETAGIPIYISKTGDKTAGAIFVIVSNLNGKVTLYRKELDKFGKGIWRATDEGSEVVINDIIRRQSSIDEDLWVLEVEDPKGRHFLDELIG